MKKQIAIGIEDYGAIQNYFYVDKTLFIKDIIDAHLYKSVLVTRPRRFGKSLMLSMVEHFFNIAMDSRPLFQDKKIMGEGEVYASYMNQYPVIHLNMKNTGGSSKEEIISKIIEQISLLYRQNAFLLEADGVFDIERDYFMSLANKRFKKDYEYADALKKLTYFFQRYYGKKVILLIDEYDAPIESAYENGAYKETISFLNEFYSNALKGNDSLLFSLVTGVLQISKESLFSGLNNLEVLSVIDKPCSQYFGFTKEEVIGIKDYFDLKEDIDLLESWYGGYSFGGEKLFNPWSILNFVMYRDLRKYWVNTGSNALLGKLLDKNDEVVDTINSPEKMVYFNNALNYQDFDSDRNAIYSYLVQAGYLNAVPSNELGAYLISIPNKEIYELFKSDIIAKSLNPSLLSLASKFRKAFSSGDAEALSQYLENYVIGCYSYYDLKSEKEYQTMLTGILAVVFDTHLVKSEVNGKRGRLDILVSPKVKNDVGLIIETKYTGYQLSQARIEESARSGLTQIKKKKYIDELNDKGCSHIYIYAFAFDVRKEYCVLTETIK